MKSPESMETGFSDVTIVLMKAKEELALVKLSGEEDERKTLATDERNLKGGKDDE